MPRLLPLALLLAAYGDCAGDFTAGISADHSSGKYGSDIATGISSLSLNGAWMQGNWTARVNVPWLRVSGDPNVIPGLGGVPNENPLGRGRLPIIGELPGGGEDAPERGSAEGLGDVTASLAYSVPTGRPLGIDVGVNAKFATADADKGLGTGANDYGVSVDLYRDFDGTMLFGGVGRTRLGDTEYIDVDDVTGANLGLSHALGAARRARIGAMVNWRSAAASERDDRRDATVFYTLPTRGSGRFQFYASRGLSDASPDWGAGVAISTGF